jgi:hypothetical protein
MGSLLTFYDLELFISMEYACLQAYQANNKWFRLCLQILKQCLDMETFCQIGKKEALTTAHF